jgi:SagB-type dehydrogenase family enzyme
LKEAVDMTENVDYRYIVHYKTYPRFEKIELPDKIESPLSALLAKRRSRREPSAKEITSKLVHAIIHQAAGRTGADENSDLRAYPSAGARYPLEVYLLANGISNHQDGFYHYSPLDSSLEVLWEGPTVPTIEASNLFGEQDFLESCKAMILISAIPSRTVYKYGEEGGIFPYIEAGYLGQNIHLLCEEQNINSVILGIQWWSKCFEEALDLNPEYERIISAIAILGGV